MQQIEVDLQTSGSQGFSLIELLMVIGLVVTIAGSIGAVMGVRDPWGTGDTGPVGKFP